MPTEPTIAVYAKQTEFNLTPWACGPTSLYSALKLLGHRDLAFDTVVRHAGSSRVTEEVTNIFEYFNDLFGTEYTAGFDQSEMTRAARKLGYRTDEVYDDSPSVFYRELVEQSHGTWPALVGVDDDTHWVMICGVTADGAWVMDPDDNDDAFLWYTKEELLGRCESDESPCYCGFVISPESDAAQARALSGYLPAGDVLFGLLDECQDPDESQATEQMIVELRADLDQVFQGIPQGGGAPAGEVFRAFSENLVAAGELWCGDVEDGWFAARAELIQELLDGNDYVVPDDYDTAFASQLGFLMTLDALTEADVDAGEEDAGDFLTFWDDAPDVFAWGSEGSSVFDYLERNLEAIAASGEAWIEDEDASRLEGYLRALGGQAIGQPWAVPEEAELAVAAELAVLLTCYSWYVG